MRQALSLDQIFKGRLALKNCFEAEIRGVAIGCKRSLVFDVPIS